MEAVTDKARKANGQFAKKQLGYKKKSCTVCGRRLWLRDFGRRSNKKNFPDGHDYVCMECRRAQDREKYRRDRKIPDGLFLNSEGRAVKHDGYSVRLYWGEETVKKFIRMFPVTKNEDMAIEFECSQSTVSRRAKELGLVKDPAFIKRISEKALKQANFASSVYGNTADLTNFLEAGKKYYFKKGEMNGAALKRHQARLEREGKLNAEVV